MDWSTRITIRFFVTAIADCVVIQRPQTLIRMLMRPDDYINTIDIQQFLQTKPESSHTRIAMWTALVPRTWCATQLYCKITKHSHVLWHTNLWTNNIDVNNIKLHAWFIMVAFLTICKAQNILRTNPIQIYKIYSRHFLLAIKQKYSNTVIKH